MNNFYSEAELMVMPLARVRSLDIQNGDQERLVQRVVDRRLAVLPATSPVNRRDVPDIKNQEEERNWQDIISKREAGLKPSLMSIDAAKKEDIKEYEHVDMLDPEAKDFNPSNIEMAEKDGEGTPVTFSSITGNAVPPGMEAGTPVVLSSGVDSKLVRKTSKTKK